MPAAFTVPLLSRERVADGTMAFHFRRPENFEFTAGQNIDMTLLHPPETDMEGNRRTFSLVSTPYDPELVVATRIRNTAFKRSLRAIPLGHEVKIEGPYGSFTLPDESDDPVVFLTGGIGITPVFNLLKLAARDHLPHRLLLFYSNRRPKDAAFLDALTALAKDNPRFTLVPTMTKLEPVDRPWSGKTGHIDAAMIAEHIKDISVPLFYLSGPVDMVGELRQMLKHGGVKSKNIVTEEFTGY